MPLNNNEIELQSEKTRKIIGKVPSFLLRNGILITTIVILILLSMSYFIPYTQILKTEIFLFPNKNYTAIRAPHDGVFMSENSIDSIIGYIQIADDLLPIYLQSGKSPIRLINNNTFLSKNDIICYINSDQNDNFYIKLQCSINELRGIQQAKDIILTLDNSSVPYHCYLQSYSLGENSDMFDIIMKIDEEYNNLNMLETYIYQYQGAKITLVNKSFFKRIFNLSEDLKIQNNGIN